jgi:hypothetical protein
MEFKDSSTNIKALLQQFFYNVIISHLAEVKL